MSMPPVKGENEALRAELGQAKAEQAATAAEAARRARYQMPTIEKVSCSSALGSPDPDLLTGP